MRTPCVKIEGNGGMPFWKTIMPMTFKLQMTLQCKSIACGPKLIKYFDWLQRQCLTILLRYEARNLCEVDATLHCASEKT